MVFETYLMQTFIRIKRNKGGRCSSVGHSIVKKWRNESLLVVGQKKEEEFQNHTMILNELLGGYLISCGNVQ